LIRARVRPHPSGVSERVHRTNFAGSASKVRPSPVGGGVLVDAAVARVGVLRYSDASGREWFELLPEEEVFSAASTDTLRGSAVTIDHPPSMVSASTWQTLSVGHPAGDASRDGDLLLLPLAVQAADAVEKVNAGELHDVSTGYTCRVEATPGTWRGERYDAIQRELRYNHVALLPEGAGRAGTEVSLRLNGGAVEVRANSAQEGHTMADDAKNEAKAAQMPQCAAPKANAETEHAQELAGLKAQLTAVTQALTAATAKIAQLEAAEQAEPEPGKVNDAVTEEMVPEAVKNSIAEKRLALWGIVSDVLGRGVKLNGKSERELKELVAAKILGDEKIARDLPMANLDGILLGATSAARANGSTSGLRALGETIAPRVNANTSQTPALSPFERSQQAASKAWDRSNRNTDTKGDR